MRIRFHGAIDEVTGSCYELIDEAQALHILVDCGLVQGDPTADARNRRPLPFDPATLTHVFLTHAHIDHSGLLPRLYAQGYKGSVYCTSETAELAKLVQEDAARLGEVPYTPNDVARQAFHEPSNTTTFGRWCPLGKDFWASFYRSGHIAGATSITLRWGPNGPFQKNITFSGDVGPNPEDRESLPLLGYFMSPPRSQYLVVESTYGGTKRPPQTPDDRIAALAGVLDRGLERGTIIIPTFAIGRLADVLCDLTVLFAREPERYRRVPVIVDTKLGLEANRVYARAMARTFTLKDGMRVRDAWLGRGLYRLLGLDPGSSADRELVLDAVREMLDEGHRPARARSGALTHWRRIWRSASRDNDARSGLRGPAIVLASGGMCEGGPVQHYLHRLLRDASTTVLFPGFCAPSTIGGKLLALRTLDLEQRRRSEGVLALEPGEVPTREVRATIEKLDGYSAHADQAGLLDWLWSGRPGEPRRPIGETIFISHGMPHPRQRLEAAIRERALETGEQVTVHLPPLGQWYDLDRGQWIEEGVAEVELLRREVGRLRREVELLGRMNTRLRADLGEQRAAAPSDTPVACGCRPVSA